jgi:putative flippase GtrA
VGCRYRRSRLTAPDLERSSRQEPSPGPEAARSGADSESLKYGKFLLVGLTGAVVNLTAFVLAVDGLSGLPLSNFYPSILHYATKTAPDPTLYLVGGVAGFAAATFWNFTWNSLWTFRAVLNRRHAPARLLGLYFAVSIGALGVNETVLFATQLVLPPLFGQGIGIVAGSVLGFLGNSRYTFAEFPRARSTGLGPTRG